MDTNFMEAKRRVAQSKRMEQVDIQLKSLSDKMDRILELLEQPVVETPASEPAPESVKKKNTDKE